MRPQMCIAEAAKYFDRRIKTLQENIGIVQQVRRGKEAGCYRRFRAAARRVCNSACIGVGDTIHERRFGGGRVATLLVGGQGEAGQMRGED